MIIFHKKLNNITCRQIIKKFEELNKKKIVSEVFSDDIRIFGFEKFLSKKIVKLFFDIDKKSSIKFFKKKPDYHTLMVNKVFPPSEKKNSSIGSGGGWHRDSYLSEQMKTIYYLTKVNVENGPFSYLEPKLKIFSRFYPIGLRFKDNIQNALNFCSKKILITSKNSGLGFSIITNYIHRGMPIKKNSRYALTVYSYFKKNNLIEKLKV